MRLPRSHVFFCQGCQTVRSVTHLGRAFQVEQTNSIFLCDECLEEEEPEHRHPSPELRQEISETDVWTATMRWATERGQDLTQAGLDTLE